MTNNIYTFFFGRLNVLGSTEDKYRFINDALNAGAAEIFGKFKYGFFDIQEVTLNNEVFAFGRIVKYKPLLEGEVVDEGAHALIEGGLPQRVVAKAEFFLHHRTSVIAFRPVASRISSGQFRLVFSRLIEAGHQKYFVSAQIDTIEEELEIRDALQKLEIVRRISIDIHPTNPSNRPVYQNVNERLKALEAQRLRQVIEGGENGLNKRHIENDDAFRGLLMAADGYGKGRIEGSIQGNKVVITTEDSPIRKEVVASETPSEILVQLFPAFQRIWERVKE